MVRQALSYPSKAPMGPARLSLTLVKTVVAIVGAKDAVWSLLCVGLLADNQISKVSFEFKIPTWDDPKLKRRVCDQCDQFR